MKKRNVVVSGASDGFHCNQIQEIFNCIKKKRPVVIFDCGFSYEKMVRLLSEDAVFHEITDQTNVFDLELRSVTVFEFESVSKDEPLFHSKVAGVVAKLLANEDARDIFIDEAWHFRKANVAIEQLLDSYEGNVAMRFYAFEDMQSFGLNSEIVTDYTVYPTHTQKYSYLDNVFGDKAKGIVTNLVEASKRMARKGPKVFFNIHRDSNVTKKTINEASLKNNALYVALQKHEESLV